MYKGCINMLKKRKKNGFTLVELLAVIVILAVVILIAVTAVLPRMNKAKKNSFYDEAVAYLKAGTEAYVADESVECYNIDDLKEYIKQPKSGYTGVLFVNEQGSKLYITDVKYYLVSNDNMNAGAVVETMPSKFISSCSDTSKTYNITYDLDGGTLTIANPSSYTPNTPTITLNNPTKSGYRFVGWSSKNLFDKSKYLLLTDLSQGGGGYKHKDVELKPNTTYVISRVRYNGFTGKIAGYLLFSNVLSDGNFVSGNYWTAVVHPNSPNGSPVGHIYTTDSSGKIYLGRSGLSEEEWDMIWPNTDVQIEEGSTTTDYQEYMAPTTNAKVYRGSVGNKKFIANWEAL